MDPGVCYLAYRLYSVHFDPTNTNKRLIYKAKPSIFNWSNSSKIDIKSNLIVEPMGIKKCSSQIKGEYLYLLKI